MSAAILSLGFTACSDDDDNNTTGSYSETFTMHFSLTPEDEDEFIQAYYNATDLTTDCEAEAVTITGKDSADCS